MTSSEISSTSWRVADLAHPLEVALLRRDAAAGVLQRLEDHGRDGVGALELDLLLDLLGGPERVAVVGPAVAVGVRDVAAAGGERLELRAELGDPGRGERPHRGAVVGDLAGDQLDLLALALQPVVVARHLQRRLDRLGAAVGEEDVVQVAGGEAGDALGQLDRAGMRVAPVGDEVELADLGGHRVADLLAAVAGVDAEEGREAVEVAVALGVVDVGALAALDDRDRVLGVVAAHPREVHPQVRAGSGLQVGRSALWAFGGTVWGVAAISSTSSIASTGCTNVRPRGTTRKRDLGQRCDLELY